MINNTKEFDVIVIGGGLAGLAASIHLAQKNISVLLIEKNAYNKHKVCGEYISNEVLPYLEYLGLNVFDLGATKINKLELSTCNNTLLKSDLPQGGFGISRYLLDQTLAEKAKTNGVIIKRDSVLQVKYIENQFQVITKGKHTYRSKIAIGAYGKRSNLDVELKRTFIQKKSPYLGVKIHLKGDFPEDVIALHNFKGGYCGVSKVENGVINMCYITQYKYFKKFKNINEFQESVVFKNTYLKSLFQHSTPLFEKPLSISQISFSYKSPIENHILMCGDTAGMIHPLCGNGMSMAIRSAQMASELILVYLKGECTRAILEKKYRQRWNEAFNIRLSAGHYVAKLFDRTILTEVVVTILKQMPKVILPIIKLTHGKPMQV